MVDLLEIPEALVKVSRLVEENRLRLETAMSKDLDFNAKHVSAIKQLADSAKVLSQEARQWGDLNRERAKNRSVADNIELACRYLASLNKGDRIAAYTRLVQAEAARDDGAPLQLSPAQ